MSDNKEVLLNKLFEAVITYKMVGIPLLLAKTHSTRGVGDDVRELGNLM